MKLVPLNSLFHIKHGTKLDINKLNFSKDGVIFVSRTSENLGVIDRVEPIESLNPLTAGTITVSLGGTYLLSAYIQKEQYYTAQNIKILIPKIEMDFATKAYYCMCITANRFRYTSHGREANRTLDTLLVPDISEIPEWVYNTKIENPSSKPILNKSNPALDTSKWKEFRYDEIFEISRGKLSSINELEQGNVPVITATENNNGVSSFLSVEQKYIEKSGCITVSNNGSIAESFYQDSDFSATSDISVLRLKNINLSQELAMFLNTLIHAEKYRFNYGRKWSLDRMQNSVIKLPVDSQGNPDWEFMENYIKTLPYSSSLGQINDEPEADLKTFNSLLERSSKPVQG